MMNFKKLTLALFVASSMTAFAQVPVNMEGPKLDPVLQHTIETRTMVANNADGALGVRRLEARTPISVIVNVSDAQVISDIIAENGEEATIVNDNILTGSLTPQLVQKLAEHPNVFYIKQSRQFRPLMVNTRRATKVNDVHDGKDLDTPYDGTGVLIGVIDQGFQARHIAFYDSEGKTRVKQYWNRGNYPNSATSPTATLPSGGDGIRANGHATHVTNIAAGSRVEGVNYYGIATGADLYMIPSSFNETEMLEDIKKIASYAKNKGMRAVVNMSLGSQMGPHDGSTPYDQSINDMIKKGDVFVCGAMGNEGGQRIHATYAFKGEDDVKSLLFVPSGTETLLPGQIWEMKTNGKRNVEFKPFYLVNGVKTYLTTTEQAQLYVYDNIDKYNNKHNVLFTIPLSSFSSLAGENAKFGVEMKGSEGDTIHAWIEASYGTFQGGSGYVTGNSQYLVSEGAASIPGAIAVAAYAATNTFTSQDGYVYGGTQTGQNVGAIASFSSNGPWLGGVNKPTISAPGYMLLSAFNSYDADFDANDYNIVTSVKSGTKTYYYGQMSGTSMATPVVTGILALWLQANPNLTNDQVLEILETTANHDSYAKNDWDAKFGYGKINAYEGLKKALQFAADGIAPLRANTQEPVTLQKSAEAWRILFNSNERFAEVSLYTADGKLVGKQNYGQLRQGEERVLNLQGQPSGVYVVRIHTAGADLSRKLLIP